MYSYPKMLVGEFIMAAPSMIILSAYSARSQGVSFQNGNMGLLAKV